MSNLREAVRKKATNNLLCTIHHVPVVNNLSLLFALVPDRAHDEECRLANSFENTQKSSDDYKSRETFAKGMAAKHCTPAQDVESKKFGNRYALDGVVDRIFDDQNRNIDACGQPAKLNTVSQFSLSPISKVSPLT